MTETHHPTAQKNKATQISRLSLGGFASIRSCDIELTEMNVLIGPNGAGKSNFIRFFSMLQSILEGKLQIYTSKQGGPDALLYLGRKHTERMHAAVFLGEGGYKFALEPTQDNRLIFVEESVWSKDFGEQSFGAGHTETRAAPPHITPNIVAQITAVIKRWRVYHFHDTSETSFIKQRHGINDNLYLRPDARNLAAYLFFLKTQHPVHYERIVKTTRLMAPFFGDLHLRPIHDNTDQIELEWTEKGVDIPFKAHQLSDGTLRFLCLTTVLMQPEERQPDTILIDEPELGLHPFALRLLGSMLRSASKQRQVIVSTQSPDLLTEFQPEDIIVADRAEGCTHLRRLDRAALSVWLEEYSLGELWQKNLLGGRPAR